jgi:hypothetical protein
VFLILGDCVVCVKQEVGPPRWGAAKVCDVDQYGAPPMDRSKEDGQAGYTGKPYWGAVKKACGVDQYGAPPMDELKNGQAGALATVHVGVPATAAVAQGSATPVAVPTRASTAVAASKEPTAPTTGPAGALAPTVRKRRPVRGWSATVPTTMPAGTSTTAAAAKEPAAGPTGVLTPAVMKGGLAGGWGRAAAVAPAEAPAAATAPTARSREVTVAA